MEYFSGTTESIVKGFSCIPRDKVLMFKCNACSCICHVLNIKISSTLRGFGPLCDSCLKYLIRTHCFFKISTQWFYISLENLLQPRQGTDLVTDEYVHDLGSDIGFIYAIRQLLRLKEGSLAYFALPCNSFGFMSCATHQRTVWQPFGNLLYMFVCVGNILGTRMVLLMMLAACRGVHYFIENPENSAVRFFPYLVHLMSIKQLLPNRTRWCPIMLCRTSCGSKHFCNIWINSNPKAS